VNDKCVAKPPTCKQGEELVNGKCVPKCKKGEELVNGKCVPQCGKNQELVNGKCVPKKSAGVDWPFVGGSASFSPVRDDYQAAGLAFLLAARAGEGARIAR
jgi:hypothetical protein